MKRPKARAKEKALPQPAALLSFAPRWNGSLPWIFWSVWTAVVAFIYLKKGEGPLYSPALCLRLLPPVWEIDLAVSVVHIRHLLQLLLAVVVLAGVGRGLLKSLRISVLNRIETLSVSYALGIGVLGLGVFALGIAHLWNEVSLWALTAGLAILAGISNRDLLRTRSAAPASEVGALFAGVGSKLVAVLVVLLFGVFGFYALAPEISYDSLVYHLALPSLYELEGGLIPTPTNLYSGIPLHTELVFGWGVTLSDGILAKLLHWSLGLGLAVGFLGAGVRLRKPLAGWLACAVFFSTPLVGINLWKTSIDVASAYMVFLSAYALLVHLGEVEGSVSRTGLWTLSACFTGLAMSMKYTNWPLLIVLLVIFAAMRTDWKDMIRYAGISLAFVVPWIAKNWLFYGNPLFPYFQEIWRPNTGYPVDWRALQADAAGRNWTSIVTGGPTAWLDVLLHPWIISMRGGSDADFVGSLYLIFLPGLLLFKGRTRESRVATWVLLGLWLSWWPLTALPRFFIPGLAVFAFLIGVLALAEGRLVPWTVSVIVALALDNFFWGLAAAEHSGARPYLLGRMTAEDYLSRSHYTYPTPYFLSARWINQHTPAEARVLVIGDARGYYLERRFRSSSALDTDLFTDWVKNAATAEALRDRVGREGITYLLVNLAEAMRLKKNPGLTPEAIDRMDEFFRKYTRQLFVDDHRERDDFRLTVVYEVAPASPPGPPSPLAAWYRALER
jgi:hypothetical protein